MISRHSKQSSKIGRFEVIHNNCWFSFCHRVPEFTPPGLNIKFSSTVPNKFWIESFCWHVLVFFLAVCGVNSYMDDHNYRIVGGIPAQIHVFSWMVVVNFKDLNAICSGSLITERHVLTAAHCIIGCENQSRFVYFVMLYHRLYR